MFQSVFISFLTMVMALCGSPQSLFIENSQLDPETSLSVNSVVMEHSMIEYEREDILLTEASIDSSFSAEKYKSSVGITKTRSSTNWVVEGWTHRSGTDGWYVQAIGKSGEYQDNTLLDTYHYTRTFFGSKNNPYGDSGRCWDTGLVYAYGQIVPWGNTTNLIQRVYYGTVA